MDVPFKDWCEAYGLPEPEKEVRFHPTRKWRLDWCFPGKIAVEINGGMWIQGRHNRPVGFQRDMEKLNAAQILGYMVLQFSPKDIATGYAATVILDAIRSRIG